MTNTEIAAQAGDVNYQRDLMVSLVRQSVAVKQEDPATDNHAARVKLAEAIMADPMTYAVRFAIPVLLAQDTEQPTGLLIAGRRIAPTDQDTAIQNIWDSF